MGGSETAALGRGGSVGVLDRLGGCDCGYVSGVVRGPHREACGGLWRRYRRVGCDWVCGCHVPADEVVGVEVGGKVIGGVVGLCVCEEKLSLRE